VNSPYNTTFRTTGLQTVFNAEAQAMECALFVQPVEKDLHIIADSESLTKTIEKLKQLCKTAQYCSPIIQVLKK
jgi:hypothetical protein